MNDGRMCVTFVSLIILFVVSLLEWRSNVLTEGRKGMWDGYLKEVERKGFVLISWLLLDE